MCHFTKFTLLVSPAAVRDIATREHSIGTNETRQWKEILLSVHMREVASSIRLSKVLPGEGGEEEPLTHMHFLSLSLAELINHFHWARSQSWIQKERAENAKERSRSQNKTKINQVNSIDHQSVTVTVAISTLPSLIVVTRWSMKMKVSGGKKRKKEERREQRRGKENVSLSLRVSFTHTLFALSSSVTRGNWRSSFFLIELNDRQSLLHWPHLFLVASPLSEWCCSLLSLFALMLPVQQLSPARWINYSHLTEAEADASLTSVLSGITSSLFISRPWIIHSWTLFLLATGHLAVERNSSFVYSFYRSIRWVACNTQHISSCCLLLLHLECEYYFYLMRVSHIICAHCWYKYQRKPLPPSQ